MLTIKFVGHIFMSMTPSQPTRPLDIIRSPNTAAKLLQPMRRQILENLSEPRSASGLARMLGLPRQKVNYHLRELEKGGLVELVEERRRGNCTERLVKATARSYLISPEVLGTLGSRPEEIRDRFSVAYLVATAGRVVRDVARAAGKSRRGGPATGHADADERGPLCQCRS